MRPSHDRLREWMIQQLLVPEYAGPWPGYSLQFAAAARNCQIACGAFKR